MTGKRKAGGKINGKRRLRRNIAALAAAGLFVVVSVFSAPLVYASEDDSIADEAAFAVLAEDDPVADEAAFAAWVANHASTGGTLTLGADITITESVNISSYAPGDAVIRVETGNYGITVAGGGQLTLYARVHIIGDGAPSPVIQVETGGIFRINGTDVDNTSVTASATGGIALFLADGSIFQEAPGAEIRLRATGANGIALYTHTLFESGRIEDTLTGHVMEAAGAGGKAIVSTVPINLFLCRVTGDAAAVDAPETSIDTCAVSPAVPGATVTDRVLRLAADTRQALGISPMGDLGWDKLSSLAISYRANAELVADGVENRSVVFQMSFDVSAVNADVPGVYPMPGSAPPAPYDLAPNDFAEIDIEIFDPAIPRFLSAQKVSMPPPMRYSFGYCYTGERSDLVLWRSDNGGDDWYQYWRGADDFAASEDISVTQNGELLSLVVRNPMETLSGEILFVFEVLSLQTDTRTLRVDLSESDFSVDGIGGDRTGTDRASEVDGNVRGDEGDGNTSSGDANGNTNGENGPSGENSGINGNTPVANGGNPSSNASLNGQSNRLASAGSGIPMELISTISPSTPLMDEAPAEPEQKNDQSHRAAAGSASEAGANQPSQSSLPEPWQGVPYMIAAAVLIVLCAAGYAVRRFRPFGKKSL